MAWVDADYRFVSIDVGSYIVSSDSFIFLNSNMGKGFKLTSYKYRMVNNCPVILAK